MNSTEQSELNTAQENAKLQTTERSKSKPEKIDVGSVWKSNKCGDFIVLVNEGWNKVLIKFIETGTCITTRASHVASGNVRDYMFKSVLGVGFIGLGRHAAMSGGRKTKAYNCWRSMIARCYDEEFHKIEPTYSGCEVCEEWHNFQNFAEWYYANHPQDGEKWQLDKDYKLIGNRVYSPITCIFIPALVNSFITDSKAARGRFLIGVSLYRDKKTFTSKCNDPLNKNKSHIGQYADELSAHLAWRKRKSQYCDDLINYYDSKVIKDALRNYKNSLDNNLIHTY